MSKVCCFLLVLGLFATPASAGSIHGLWARYAYAPALDYGVMTFTDPQIWDHPELYGPGDGIEQWRIDADLNLPFGSGFAGPPGDEYPNHPFWDGEPFPDRPDATPMQRTFTVLWTGYITFPSSGTWQFAAGHDDGFAIRIGNQVVFERDTFTWDRPDAVPPAQFKFFEAQAGIKYPFEARLYQSIVGGNWVHAKWQQLGGTLQEIPTEAFTLPATYIISGDTDGDDDIDTADLTAALQNFTGDGGAGRTVGQGDTDGDGDVDTADITRALQNFTGSIEADLLYDPTTGNVKLDASVLPRDMISQFSLTNAAGGLSFNAGVASIPFGGSAQTLSPTEISNMSEVGTGFSGLWDLGNVFPTGLDQTDLAAFLTSATYAGTPGTGPSRAFDLVVLNPTALAVPEPSSFCLAALGLMAIVFSRRSRRQQS